MAGLAVFLWLAAFGDARAAQLVMFRIKACPYCAAWDADIGGVYDKTAEGRAAPLREVDMDGRIPPDLQRIAGLVYSPTFVLVEDGQEIGRIIGHPGPDFFWPLLANLLKNIEKKE